MISYKKLWIKLIENDMLKKDLMTELSLSSSTIAKLGKDEMVSLDVLIKICRYWNCQISDICEVVYE